MLKKEGNILITGCAGFIGAALCKRFLKDGYVVLGIDNINNYYDVKLKKDRLESIYEFALRNNLRWVFNEISIEDRESLENLFSRIKPKLVINLAAQAGVRYSIKNPRTYFKNNLEGFFNILEVSRLNKIKHLIYK